MRLRRRLFAIAVCAMCAALVSPHPAAAILAARTPAELLDEADAAAVGRVTRMIGTHDGVTDWAFTTSRSARMRLPSEITLRVPGGSVSPTVSVWVEDSPDLGRLRGHEVLLLLNEYGQGTWTVLASPVGPYLIDDIPPLLEGEYWLSPWPVAARTPSPQPPRSPFLAAVASAVALALLATVVAAVARWRRRRAA